MLVLAIESSCDDTAVAIYDDSRGLIANCRHQQHMLHAEYGGVVPEIAARDHLQRIIPLLDTAFTQAKCNKTDITAIAYTKGPGLVGSLLVGASTAKALSLAWGIPSLGVHHLEAHIMAAFLSEPAPEYPFVCLLVSGGHSMLIDVSKFGEYKIIGQTLDDAVGEAFDKVAKMLNLGYPGGPAIEALAQQAKRTHNITLPRPMLSKPGLDLSFSGLKTHVRNLIANNADAGIEFKADLAAAFEQAVADTLSRKLERAIKQTDYKSIVCVGGVSANKCLRNKLDLTFSKNDVRLFYPKLEFCTDNAAMVAMAGQLRLALGFKDKDLAVEVCTRWDITKIN